MITLYVLLVLAASVHGYQDLEDVCPYDECVHQNPSKYSDTTALKIRRLSWSHGSDLEVVRLTPNLRILNVYNCSSDFKMDVFPSMAHLKEININNCHISELNKYQFENVINLSTLNLAGNSIERVFNETFHKLSGLTILILGDNLIQVLPEGVFNTLKDLFWLDLSKNNISILTKDIFLRNRMLTMLDLTGNPLKAVNLAFRLTKYINTVDFYLRDCGELRELRLSAELDYLNLENSGVETLQVSGSISKIYHKNSKVTHADLHGSEFWQSFEKVLCDLPSLEWLDLSKSSKAPFSTSSKFDGNGTECTFPNLSFLNLSEINLKKIPRRLPFFGPNLTTLDLSRNLLDDESLDYLFILDIKYKSEANFPSLRFLNMSNNLIRHIPRWFPLFGPNLTTLDLSQNLLEVVFLESFAEAQSLQSLFLEGNRLTSFDYLAVCDGLKNLKQLALFDNHFYVTFYNDMTKYFDDKDLHLIQKEKIIIEMDKNEHLITKANQTLPRTKDQVDINRVAQPTDDVHRHHRNAMDLTVSIVLLVIIIVLAIVFLGKKCNNTP